MYEIFKSYVENYDLNNKRIKHKYEHSLRVAAASEELSLLLGLSDEDRDLAILIGLLHDIGRFEQIKRYDSFKSSEFDHGDFANKILFEDKLIEKLNVNEKFYSIIKKAIFNHNKLTIEDGLTEHELLHANIIRDVDKLDNIRFLSKGKRVDEIEEDVSVTNSIMEYIRNEQSVPFSLVKGGNDAVAVNFAFIFDVVFLETVMLISYENLYDCFYNNLEYKNHFNEALGIVNNYIRNRLKGDR